MSIKKQFKNKAEALLEADKILRLIHHYNGEYKHLIESSYLERLNKKTKSPDEEIRTYFKKKK
tara:strand:- start:3015 stop:3203 length:189 start_codon:yes stop_codon:yes gene_type:complete